MRLDGVRGVVSGAMAALVAIAPLSADPYTPPSDDTVLQVLTRPIAPSLAAREREALRPGASDPERAAELAAAYVEANSASGEPRYLGYALKALAPWSSEPEPPLEIWLLRTRIDQRLHSFASAQADLESLLRAHPRSVDAAMLLSTVSLVQGDYAAADEACNTLRRQGAGLMAHLCGANRAQFGGSMSQSLASVTALLDAGAIPRGALEVWALTLAAELAVGLGDEVGAAALFRRAFDSSQRLAALDLYLLGSYADFLTDAGEGAAALELLRDAPATDAMLIRRAVALPDGEERIALAVVLRERMADLAARGAGDAHAREQAWFHLHVARDPAAGLAFARANWQTQREMRDARLLLEAAAAANEPAAARPVTDWMRTNAIRHAWLEPLAARLPGAEP